jgi:hypothetical protein
MGIHACAVCSTLTPTSNPNNDPNNDAIAKPKRDMRRLAARTPCKHRSTLQPLPSAGGPLMQPKT